MTTELSVTRDKSKRPAIAAKAPEHIPADVRAYAAGFIDGEGCISIRKQNPENMPGRVSPCFGICIQVVNTHQGTLDFLTNYFGGHVYKHKHWEGQNNGWKPRFVWVLYERQAYYALMLLFPYLHVKKEHAQICIDFYETRRHKPSQTRLPPEEIQRSQRYYYAIRALNKRGAQNDH